MQGLLPPLVAAMAMAGPATAQTVDAEIGPPLILEVVLNGSATGLVVPFARKGDGRLLARRSDLVGLRLPVPADAGVALVELSKVPGLRFRYREETQSILLDIAPSALLPYRVDAAGAGVAGPEIVELPASTGAILNYGALVSAARGGRLRFTAASAALDARVFGRWGTLRQTGIVGADGQGPRALRLDSTFTRIFPERRLTLIAGDAVSGGATWSRPIRFGGLQVQHDFSLRPDLVTVPLPSISGTAALPSTLDVYVNGVRGYSADVPAGRFALDNLPVVAGGGKTRSVLRDAQGREVVSTTPYFVSPSLLRRGLTEWSVEIGVPRLGYGIADADYRGGPFLSATGRLGARDRLTIQGHLEATSDLLLAGGGFATPTGTLGVASLTAAGSVSDGRAGLLLHGAYEAQLGALRVSMDGSRVIGRYRDVPALTAEAASGGRDRSASLGGEPPRSVARMTLSTPVPLTGGGLGLAYAYEDRRGARRVSTASASYNQALGRAGALSASAFRSFERRGAFGAFASYTVPLGRRAVASAGLAASDGRIAPTLEASRFAGPEPGDWGWRVAASEGRSPFRSASAEVQTSVGLARVQLASNGGGQYATATMDGALVLDRSPFLTPRIDGAFTIVGTGAPDVPVLLDGQRVGRTNRRGELVVTRVRPFDVNHLELDTTGLPLDVEITRARIAIRPTTPDGVRVSFATTHAEDGALVRLVDASGVDLPVGTPVRFNGGPPMPVGYAGLIHVAPVAERNAIVVDAGVQACTISFGRPTPLPPGVPHGPLACPPPVRYAHAVVGQEAR